MGEEQDQDLPIALRRTPRRSLGAAQKMANRNIDAKRPSSTSLTAKTPSKPKSKKRVRFSDPGPDTQHDHSHDQGHGASSTGLTPMVRRSTLGAPSPKRRRHSTPLRRSDDEDELAGDGTGSNEVRVFSLRQVLDDRVKRRIRRNGLSEEMHAISTSRRGELQRLRDELAAKDGEISRLHEATVLADADRVAELEAEVARLRSEVNDRSALAAAGDGDADRDEDGSEGTVEANTTMFDWSLAARDPFSDTYMDISKTYMDIDVEDEGFGDSTMADLITGTPSRRRRNSVVVNAGSSFPTPPCTSPPMPGTPCSLRGATPPITPQSHAGVQASLPDPEKEALEEEMISLKLELSKLTDTLETHASLQSRLSSKLAKAQSSSPETPKGVEAHLDLVLQTLSDRTAALMDLNASISALGFPGRDASDIVSSITSAFRTARLELEYLTPGENVLPLHGHGAEVLDLILTRLRDLARQSKDDEASIDEYHSLEQSLRQQLGARCEAMDGMRRALAHGQETAAEKDARISELELGLARLKGAAESYQRDMGELEALVQRLEAAGRQCEEKLGAARSDLAAAGTRLGARDAAVADLEAKLAEVTGQTEGLTAQLRELQALKDGEVRALQRRREVEVRTLNKLHGKSLALRDARVGELRREIDGVSEALRGAHQTIMSLRLENGGLTRAMADERQRAKEAVDGMRAELERVVRMGSEFLVTPKKGGEGREMIRRSMRRLSAEAGDAMAETGHGFPEEPAKSTKGKKRRRYDSGLGFLDEDEDEVELVV
ncbi:hypothetical protein F5Y15DRAFT_423551 [Xylariaceae sp. FL0016]|nr:hypothetical protein F5Y15DRAFT_423551 [Xylariaceae sp. FL0016]